MQESLNILINIDENYIDRAKDLIYTIKKYNDVYIALYLIYNNINKKHIDDLSKYMTDNNYGELHCIYCNINDEIFPQKFEYISKVTYLRLFAPFYLKDKVDKILYLDCDILCNGNIVDLYNTDFEDNIFIACENMLKEELKLWGIVNNRRLRVKDDYKYINAGVLLINVNKYVEVTTQELIIKFIKDNYEALIFQDQDVINKVFHKKIKIVSNIYNYQINSVVKDYMNDVRLVHYSENQKPWNDDYKSPKKALYYYKLLREQNKIDRLRKLIKTHCQNMADNIFEMIMK